MGMSYQRIGNVTRGELGPPQYSVRCDRCGRQIHTGRRTPRSAEYDALRYRRWKRVVILGGDVYGKVDESAWWLCPECVRVVRGVVNAPAG